MRQEDKVQNGSCGLDETVKQKTTEDAGWVGGFHKERGEAVVTTELRRVREMSCKCFIPRSSRSVSSDTRSFSPGERE